MWTTLLSCVSQLAIVEKLYMNLLFLTPKGFLRKEVSYFKITYEKYVFKLFFFIVDKWGQTFVYLWPTLSISLYNCEIFNILFIVEYVRKNLLLKIYFLLNLLILEFEFDVQSQCGMNTCLKNRILFFWRNSFYPLFKKFWLRFQVFFIITMIN